MGCDGFKFVFSMSIMFKERQFSYTALRTSINGSEKSCYAQVSPGLVQSYRK